jgi:DNA processing protein
MPLTLSIDELGAWMRLSLEPGLGPAQARSLLAAIGLPHDVYASSMGQLTKLLPQPLAQQLKAAPSPELRASIDDALKWLDHPDHHLLTLADPVYPASLLTMHDPPLLLYVNGSVALLSRPSIAVVGARSATVAGIDNARSFSRYLAEQGWCIISGLALGIDAAAHEGALIAGPHNGSTIAVLGTGINIVYPARNRDLAHRIAASGALVSEFPLNTRAMPYQFPKRNRLVAGLSQGVLVVEAARQSGSLITARLASEMGREVFAIPGSIHSPLSRGCHALIRQGAKLVESGHDIHEELGRPGLFATTKSMGAATGLQSMDTATDAISIGTSSDSGRASLSQPVPQPSKEAATLLESMGYEPVHVDQLSRHTGMALPRLHAFLLELELAECVFRLPDGRFQRREGEVASPGQTHYHDRLQT